MNVMDIILMPENLRKVLGDEASKELIDLVATTRKSVKESILETAADRFERRLAEFKGEVKEEISEVKAQVSEVKADLIKWMFVFWIGQIAVITGIIMVLIK
ncbi:MAG TPA: hypothetical protein DD791_09925 [Syntrophomonas sp.]|nr:hypothetical protein [Syntrophomonas sp.]